MEFCTLFCIYVWYFAHFFVFLCRILHTVFCFFVGFCTLFLCFCVEFYTLFVCFCVEFYTLFYFCVEFYTPFFYFCVEFYRVFLFLCGILHTDFGVADSSCSDHLECDTDSRLGSTDNTHCNLLIRETRARDTDISMETIHEVQYQRRNYGQKLNRKSTPVP